MGFQYLVTVPWGKAVFRSHVPGGVSVESGARGSETATTQLSDHVGGVQFQSLFSRGIGPLKRAIAGLRNWRSRLALQGMAGRARLTSGILRSHTQKLPSGHQMSLVHFFSALFSLLGDFFPSSMGLGEALIVLCVYSIPSAFLVGVVL